MTDKPKVLVFYSSKTEPELLTFYADGLAYLKDQEIELDVIDISENAERAKDFDVVSTPTVLLVKDEEIVERYEVVSYLNGILERSELKKLIEKD